MFVSCYFYIRNIEILPRSRDMQRVYESAQAVSESLPVKKKVTLVGGSFDLLHVGHLHVLEYARKRGGALVVCVLSDSNVRSYKGSNRPIVGEQYRADMVAALRCVDRAYVSHIDTSHQDTLSILRPANVVFGIEDTYHWRDMARRREQFIRSILPEVKIYYLERFSDSAVSTSGYIQKILRSYGNQ